MAWHFRRSVCRGLVSSLARYDLKLYKTTQEFRLTSKDDGPIQWLVGAFYTNENSKQNQTASGQTLDYTPIAGLDPLAVVALPSTYKEYAAFGDFTYKFNSMFDVTGGVRWAHNKQNFSADQQRRVGRPP